MLLDSLRPGAFFQRFSEFAQVFFLFLALVQRQRAVVFERDAAEEVKGVAVPVVELIAAVIDLLPFITDGAAVQTGARGERVFFVAGLC